MSELSRAKIEAADFGVSLEGIPSGQTRYLFTEHLLRRAFGRSPCSWCGTKGITDLTRHKVQFSCIPFLSYSAAFHLMVVGLSHSAPVTNARS